MPNWKKLIVSGSDAYLSGLNVTNAVTASFFKGDGSGLTNVDANISEVATVSDTFTSTTSKSVNHSFGTKDVIVTVYNDSDQQVIPATVTTTDLDNVTVTFDEATTGRIVIAKGGHIVSGSIVNIGEVATVEDTFTSVTSKTVTHTFGTKNVFVTVYNDSDDQIIPARVNTPNTGSVTVEFDAATTGRIVIGKAGHVVTGSSAAQWDSILNKPNGLVSGSDQLTGSYDTRYALSGSSGVSDFDQLTNSPFSQSANAVTIEKSLIPSGSAIDLGSTQSPFRDLYLSSASLYIDGQQVISSDTQTLTFTTDVGQSIKFLETGADDIILQTDTGNIELKGTVEVLSGKKIIDSAGTKVLFGDSVGITGSIDLTGTVDGVDVAGLKSDFDTLEGKEIFSGSFNDLNGNPFISGAGAITASGHLVPDTNETYDLGSVDQRWRDLYLSGSTIFLGDTKVSRDSTGNLEVRDRQTNDLKTLRVDQLEIGSGAAARRIKVNNGRVSFTDTGDSILDAASSALPGTLSGSAQIDLTQTTNYTSGIKSRLDAESVVSSSAQVVSLVEGQNLTLNNLTVNGTQTTIDSTNLDIGDSIISLNGGGASFGGISVKDSTAPGTVSGSLLWDGLNNNWIAGLSGSESKVLLATGDSIVSGSSQISFTGITDKPTLVSSSAQIDYNSIQNQPTIPTNNNQLTNGAGYTTFTANQSVDTTSTVTFSTLTAGTITETSALRFKENIQEDIDSSIIDKLRPVSYDWKKTKERDFGFIAEEVDELDSTLTTRDENDELLGIKYTKLIPLLVKKIQEQEERIRQLENGNS